MRIRVHNEDGYVLIRVTGRYRLATARRMFEQLTAAADESMDRVLLDVLGLTGKLPVVDRFELAEFLGTHAPSSLRLAVVSPPEYLDDRVFEPVAASRGVRIRVFASLEEAAAWLLP